MTTSLSIGSRPEREGAELFFGRTPTTPFTAEQLQRRADRAWKAAGLERITPHECRHTFASLMIAAGVNAKALSTYMGHANICDHPGPLRAPDARLRGPGGGLLDAYLASQLGAAAAAARGANEELTGAPTGAPLAHEGSEPHGNAG